MIVKPKCVGALLCRNEAGEDRYLRRALDNAAIFCDEIVVLDDGSTDDTAEVCAAHEKVTRVETQASLNGWWEGGAESKTRAALWEMACEAAGDEAGWIYVFDADHLLKGIAPEDVWRLLGAEGADSWACPLFDCWGSEDAHRVDGYWQAWHMARPWLFRALPGEWPERGIHSGHAPLREWITGIMPGAWICHLGYVKAEHRVAKMAKYLALNGLSS